MKKISLWVRFWRERPLTSGVTFHACSGMRYLEYRPLSVEWLRLMGSIAKRVSYGGINECNRRKLSLLPTLMEVKLLCKVGNCCLRRPLLKVISMTR